ncbi:MAG: membrane protein insertase YidC [Alphaproteobacteria bacterium]
MNEQRNLILTIVLSILILVGFHYLYERPRQIAIVPQQTSAQAPQASSAPQASPHQATTQLERPEALATNERISIKNPQLHGSINVQGGILDDIALVNYHETPDVNSNEIMLLNPRQSKTSYFCEFSWLGNGMKLPDAQTIWQQKGGYLTPDTSVVLSYDNGEGLMFERTFSVDDQFMFQIKERVTNTSGSVVSLKPNAQIMRLGTPETGGYYILHEGPLGVINKKLVEYDYQKLLDKSSIEQASEGGWIGITDKYWLVALMPPQNATVSMWFRGEKATTTDPRYITGFSGPALEIQPGESSEYTYHLFTGAKKLHILDEYEKKLGVQKFDLAVDFGWFYFLTKPLFYLLEYLSKLLGNLGLAILAVTVIFKAVLYPLAAKSFRSMAQMKRFQPQMEVLKARHKDDKIKLQQEIMELYRKEKINPLSGCLPILIQAPIFFCLYKVLFVTIEMRHAPFFGWIHDLSAPDPTTLFNLFGLLPWTPPSFLMIGIWPILMGATMYLQQKLNPQPADPAQAKALMFMPFFLTFLLAQFPAGLVIYWAWTNILGITQQWLMLRAHKTP